MNYQRPRLLESTNPIYEGAGLYEMTPGEFTFTQPTLTLNTGPSDLTHRYVGTPPTLPPPRGDKQQDIMHAHLPLEEISSRTCRQYSEIDTLKAPVAQAEVCSTDGDEYMVMGPQNNGKGKAST